jgi:dTMP kinase
MEAAVQLALRPIPPASMPGLEPPDESGARAILDLLAGNKVPLVTLAREPGGEGDALWESIAAGHTFGEALARESDRRSKLLAEYEPVARGLEAAGMHPVLHKSPRWFPYLSSNIDVLDEPGLLEPAARVVEGLGHIRFPHYREDHKLLFRTFTGGAPALSVHLHDAVSWGKVVVVAGERVVAGAVGGDAPGVRVASPADALAATLAHTILETDQIRLGDLRTARFCLAGGARVTALLEDARVNRWTAAAATALALYDAVCREAGGGALLDARESEEVRATLRRFPWAERLLLSALPRRGVTLPHRLTRSFSKQHLVRLILADDRRDPERKVLDLAASGWNLLVNRLGLRCRPARLITVSGPDGAGKSRLAESIEGTLRLCEVPVDRLWSRGGFSRIAVGGKALARRLAAGALPDPADERAKRRFLAARWRRVLWTWVVAIEQALRLQRVRLTLLRGRSVVCDRYTFDSLADLLARLPGSERSLPSRAAGFLLGAAPQPDIAFLIEVEAGVAHARKEDGTTLASRRDLASAYEALRGAAPFHRLDGALPFPEMAQRAIVETLRRTFDAFEGRRS